MASHETLSLHSDFLIAEHPVPEPTGEPPEEIMAPGEEIDLTKLHAEWAAREQKRQEVSEFIVHQYKLASGEIHEEPSNTSYGVGIIKGGPLKPYPRE